MIMMMTCFGRYVVLGFVRNVHGLNAAHQVQLLSGYLFLTFFIMGPVWNNIYEDAVTLYWKKMKSPEALGSCYCIYEKAFMMNQTQEDAQFFGNI